MKRPQLIARRAFVQGAAATGLALAFFPRNVLADEPSGKLSGGKPKTTSQVQEDSSPALNPNVFVHVGSDGLVRITCHRSEMGQGIRSSLPVLIADELGADMAQVKILQGDGDKAYGDQNTDGSNSVRGIYTEMRRAGATARTMLIAAAAARWKVPPETCVAQDHHVRHLRSKRRLSFGELAVEAGKLEVPKPESVQLRPMKELRRAGTKLPLLDARVFVTGTAAFGADVRLPGMLTAMVVRPPVPGGKPLQVDDTAAKAVPGVRKIVTLPVPARPLIFQPLGGVAVVADNTWAAMQGRAALKVTWEHGADASYDSEAYKAKLLERVTRPGKPLRELGDAEAALASAARTVEARYYLPHLAHVAMEPLAAVADVREGRCEIWAPTQHPQSTQTVVATALKLPPEKVTVHVTFLGGGFGRKSKSDFIAEAALLSQAVGAPVRVQWTREDDLRHDYYHSVSAQQLTAGIAKDGKVVAWRHRTAFPPIGTLFGGSSTPSATDLNLGVLDLALSIPNVRAEACEADAHVRIGWLRSVYNIFHAFSVGSFLDELAHARGKDPRESLLELHGPARVMSLRELGIEKLMNYGQPLEKHPVDVGRLRGVIEKVTQVSGWKNRKKAKRSLGLAAHRSFNSYTAAVVSVVKDAEGKLKVDEVWTAIDAGTLINADRVASQMEGSVIFGLSHALFGEISMKEGAVQQSNFGDYRLVRMNEAPRKIHVELIRSDNAPGGVGEPGVPPIAPALANAIFALTGQRIRELPISRHLAV